MVERVFGVVRLGGLISFVLRPSWSHYGKGLGMDREREEESGKRYSDLVQPEPGFGFGSRVPSCPECGAGVLLWDEEDWHYC